MTSLHIATSLRADMRPLMFNGICATDCYPQLRTLLERNADFFVSRGLSGALSFLAEPMHDAANGRIDWYAQGGEARRVETLDTQEKAQAEKTLSMYALAFQDLAKDSGQHSGAQLLLLAMQHPSKNDLWLVDGSPVLVNWGFAPGSGHAVPENILRFGAGIPETLSDRRVPPRPEPSPSPAPEQPHAKPSPLAWLLPLLLLLLLGALLWTYLSNPSLFFAAPAEHEKMQGERMRAESLQGELDSLLASLEKRAGLCKPSAKKPIQPSAKLDSAPAPEQALVEPVKPVEPAPAAPLESALPQEPRADAPAEVLYPADAGSEEAPVQSGTVVVPRTEDVVIDASALPASTQEGKEPPARPQGAPWKDLSALEGCWKSIGALHNRATGESIVTEYCFDRNGAGKRREKEMRSGKVYEGGAHAYVKDGTLFLEGETARIEGNGRIYPAESLECRRDVKNDAAVCTGKAKGKKGSWKSTFVRR